MRERERGTEAIKGMMRRKERELCLSVMGAATWSGVAPPPSPWRSQLRSDDKRRGRPEEGEGEGGVIRRQLL